MSEFEVKSFICLKVRWLKDEIAIENFSLDAYSIQSIRELLESLTNVPVGRQKLLGIVKAGKKVDESLPLGHIDPADLSLKFSADGETLFCTLIGTPDHDLLEESSSDENFEAVEPEPINSCRSSTTESSDIVTNLYSIAEFNFIEPPRDGKKLLVLDLDHTLLDFSEKDVIHPIDMKRPHLDYFLSEVYQYYDLAIWSQTSWKWLEIKLMELGLLNSLQYKLCFVLDKASMLKLTTGYVKPLHVIWNKLPYWNRTNTLHVDDLERNFVLNPDNGIILSAYYRSPERAAEKIEKERRKRVDRLSVGGYLPSQLAPPILAPTDGSDDELRYLAQYLCSISQYDDLSAINHKNWRKK